MKKTKISVGKLSLPDRSPSGPLTPALSPKGARESAADDFKQIARGEIFPDPDQPRKSFSEASLKELADSIAQQGIVQPLIVRLVPAKYKLHEPDLHSDKWRAVGGPNTPSVGEVFYEGGEEGARSYGVDGGFDDRYVIVAGERRWRAAEIAGLTELPCIVRDLDAHRVFAQQFIENEQRENISALEEAEALTKQLDERKRENGAFAVEDLAQELGMSRAGLYQRLALTRLHPPVREALLAGKISTSVAGVVAIIPLPAAQEKLLKQITDEDDYQFPYSVRDVQEIVEDEYCKQLSAAPFKLDAVVLDPNCVQFSCKDCPHRSGNLAEQFPDLAKRPNVCTRPDCFAVKCKAHWLDKAQAAADKGKTVLTTTEFRKVKGNYIEADKTGHLFQGHYWETPAQVLGKHAPEPVLVAMPDGLKKFYPKEQLAESAKKAKVKLATDRGGQTAETPEAKAKREEKELAAALTKQRREAFVPTMVPELLKALAKLTAERSWRLAALMVGNQAGGYDKEYRELFKESKDPRLAVLGHYFARNYPLDYNGGWIEEVVDAWIMAGIDPVAEFDASEKSAQKTMVLPKAAPKQAKLLDVKLNKPKGRAKAAKGAKKK